MQPMRKSLLLIFSGVLIAIAVGVAGSERQPNPEICTQCYKKLQKDYADCETLEGQDWSICREAASVAYRECSKGC